MAKNIRILVVDDEKVFCNLIKHFFVDRGYLVDIAYDGLEAKSLLERNTYDYVFFDCNMPGLSGAELAGVINEKNPTAKKIMISGYDLINEDFARNLGVDVFLTKPFSLDVVEEIIKDGEKKDFSG